MKKSKMLEIRVNTQRKRDSNKHLGGIAESLPYGVDDLLRRHQ